MKTTKVLETDITETNVNEVSRILNFSSNNCNLQCKYTRKKC